MTGASGTRELERSGQRDGADQGPADLPAVCVPGGVCTLQVFVLRDDTEAPVAKVKVTASGPETKKATTNAQGLADFGVVQPGGYALKFELPADLHGKFRKPADDSVTVPPAYGVVHIEHITPIAILRIVLVDDRDAKVGGAKWKLTSPRTREGTTGGDGLIVVDDLDGGRRGEFCEFEITLPAKPFPQAGEHADPLPDPAGQPPPYPPVLRPSLFKAPTPAFPGPVLQVSLKASADVIDKYPHASRNGALLRLNNLGWQHPMMMAGSGPGYEQLNVRGYQRRYPAKGDWKGTGLWQDIAADLRKAHDDAGGPKPPAGT